jgi:hypothetical protein
MTGTLVNKERSVASALSPDNGQSGQKWPETTSVGFWKQSFTATPNRDQPGISIRPNGFQFI